MRRLPLLLAAVCLLAAVPGAAQTLSLAQQVSLAKRYAPVLTFHPDEPYFPCSPVIDLHSLLASTDGPPSEYESLDAVGSIRARIALYDALLPSQKMRAASVMYRIRPDREGGPGALVVEYWFYYVHDVYHVRGGLVPYRLDASHSHDLEHIYLFLQPAAGVGAAAPDYAVRTIIATAHANGVPTNRYDVPAGRDLPLPLLFLVELGSHAMAPDIGRTNRFVPALDSNGTSKFVWGIRDHGELWLPYRSSYADERDPERSVRLYPDSGGPADERPTRCGGFARCYPYRLESADALEERLEPIFLPSFEHKELVGDRAWLRRAFGDVNSEALLLPSMHPDDANPERVKGRVTASDHGLFGGIRSFLPPVIFAGGWRWTAVSGSRFLPDFVFDATVLVDTTGVGRYEQNLLGAYPVDAITTFVAGASVRSQTLSTFDGSELDPAAGFEFRFGRWRLRTIALHHERRTWIDYRLTLMF